MPATVQRLSSEQEKFLRGLCPSGCPTTHGGPGAFVISDLIEQWDRWPAGSRPSWTEHLRRHGRPDLIDAAGAVEVAT